MAEISVKSDVTGVVCKVMAQVGDAVAEYDPIVLIESMKMEIPVAAPKGGTIASILVSDGEMVGEGDPVAVLKT